MPCPRRPSTCLNATVIELGFFAVLAALAGWLMRRRARQRSEAMADGEPAEVPCMLKWAALGSRWKVGRLLLTGTDPLLRTSFPGRREVALPRGLRRTGVRAPSVREGLTINPRSRIVECESAEGEVLIAVMPEDLEHVTEAVRVTSS